LIVSELITNSERHAFGNDGGSIRVELLRRYRSSNAGSRTAARAKQIPGPGHGLKIVEALAKSLGGTIDQRFGPHGATAVLIFPAEMTPLSG